jgi:hypothetical protein
MSEKTKLTDAKDRPYLLELAYDYGKACKLDFYPLTVKQKGAFARGLDDWLKEVNIDGVRGHDISELESLRGFVYTLVSKNRLNLIDDYATSEESPHILENLIELYSEGLSDNPNSEVMRRKKNDFEKGIKIAEDYMDIVNFNYFCNSYAHEGYGLDLEGKTELERHRLFELHKEVKRTVEAESKKEPITDTIHFLDMGIGLYSERRIDLDNQYITDDYDEALHSCGYLGMLLRFFLGHYDKVSSDLDEDRVKLLSGEFESAEEGLVTVSQNEECLNEYNLAERIQEIEGIENEIIELKRNPRKRLEKEMALYVEREEYEKAAEIRDKITAIQ